MKGCLWQTIKQGKGTGDHLLPLGDWLLIKSLAGLLICSNVYLLAGSTIYSLNFLIAHWFAHSLDCSLSSFLTCLLAYSLFYHVYGCQACHKHILAIVCLLIACLFDFLLVWLLAWVGIICSFDKAGYMAVIVACCWVVAEMWKTAWKTMKKQMHYQWTNQPTDRPTNRPTGPTGQPSDLQGRVPVNKKFL